MGSMECAMCDTNLTNVFKEEELTSVLCPNCGNTVYNLDPIEMTQAIDVDVDGNFVI